MNRIELLTKLASYFSPAGEFYAGRKIYETEPNDPDKKLKDKIAQAAIEILGRNGRSIEEILAEFDFDALLEKADPDFHRSSHYEAMVLLRALKKSIDT